METTVLTKQHKTAIELNQKILITAQAAQQNLYDMCVMLKQMRDDKLYKELGYQNFEDYCESEVGFGRMQAHKYIAIIENVKNVNSSLHFGVTKLALLATLSEPEQEQLQQTVNLEDTSVRELKAEIAKLKDAHKKELKELSDENTELQGKMKELVSDADTVRAELAEANEKITELESRPAEIKFLEDAHSKETIRQLEDQLDNAKERIEELESRPVEVAVQENPEAEKTIQKLENQITELEEQLDKANSKPAEIVNISNDKESFKAYYLSAVNAFENMLKFVSNCKEKEFCLEKVDRLIETCKIMMEGIRNETL